MIGSGEPARWRAVLSRGLARYGNADQSLRYLPIAGAIRARAGEDPRILEVGSGVVGITPFLPYPVTGLDLAFDGPVAKRLTPVVLSGRGIPFPDRSFDYVVSVDMLEHVREEERPLLVAEMLRVAVHSVLLAVPCGEAAQAQDRALDRLYLRKRGERYGFLREHVENGLPDREAVEACIRAAARTTKRQVRLRVLPNFSLSVRHALMWLWICWPRTQLYPLASLAAYALRRLLNRGPCYRQIFVVELL